MRVPSAIWAAALLAGGQILARAELVNGVTAIVHDSIITLHQVEETTLDVARELQVRHRGDPEGFRRKVYEAQKENLDQLVERQLILHEFETLYAPNFPESIIDQQFEEYTRRNYSDRITFIKTLQQRGLTTEKFRKQFRDRFILDQMWAKNVAGEILISPHKIEVYYVGNTNNFKVEDQVKLRMIVLNAVNDPAETRKLAGEILAKIDEGASFAEMASVYSQGSQRSQGGDWGWVERSVLRKELADAAFALNPGEKSGVIETPEAFYLMLVEDKRSAHVKPLAEVREEIEKILQAEEQKRLREQWIARLKKKTFVRYFE